MPGSVRTSTMWLRPSMRTRVSGSASSIAALRALAPRRAAAARVARST
jgi:hypothetical protein